MDSTLFATLLGVIAVVALLQAMRARTGPSLPGAATGWLVIALAALVQAANLALGYHWLVSVLTTGGLLWGAWLLTPRRPGA